MRIRPARISDATAICDLVNHHAERGLMLHRSLEGVYEALREFHVAEDADGRVAGCVALDIFWADLAEIKSLAVDERYQARGIGSELLAAAIRDARALGVKRVFALTYRREFFGRHGFEVTDRDALPEKVWRECISCPKLDACDEIAMMLHLG